MATRAPFLKTRYGAYFHREVLSEDIDHVANTCAAFGSRSASPMNYATFRIG
jgi:hypothetical protein